MTDTLKTVRTLVEALMKLRKAADARGYDLMDNSYPQKYWYALRDQADGALDAGRALIAQMQREAVQPVAQVEMVASQHERRLSWEAFQSVRAAPHLDRAAVIASGEAQGEKSGVATNGDGSEGWNAGVGLVPIQEGSLRSAVGAELLGGRASELDTGRRGQRDAELRSTESLDAVAPCAASVTRSAAATPHPEARAAQPTQDERNLAAARLPHLLKPGHGLPNDFRLVPRQPEAQALDSQLQQPDDVGSLEYRGNSVSFIHSKMTAYRTAIDEAWAALRECGQPPDGKTRLPDAIRALAALQQSDGHSTPSVSEASTVPLPLFAVGVAKRKWESLQADGYRMQRIEFARSINGQETRGSIDPWGKVLWSRRSAAGAQQQDDHAGSPAPSRVDLPDRVVDTVATSVGLSGPFGQDFYDFAQALMMEVLARVPAPSAESSKAALSDEEIDAVVEEYVYKLKGWDYGGMKVIEVNGWVEYAFARAILARAGIGESRREPQDERAAFEKWFAECYGRSVQNVCKESADSSFVVDRTWDAWQARAGITKEQA